MFRVFGHKDVAVLDGGLKKWLAEGRPVDDFPPAPRERHFTARFDGTKVREIDQVRRLIGEAREQLLDARPRGRFTGADPEPRPGLRGGHMPTARNLPAAELVGPDGSFLSADALRAKFVAAGIDPAKPVVTTCGSGVSACALALGLHLIGAKQVAVYDGSWSEWGAQADTPVATGET